MCMENPERGSFFAVEKEKPGLIGKVSQGILNLIHSKALGVLILLVLVAGVPLTVFVANQTQDTRQRASVRVANEDEYCIVAGNDALDKNICGNRLPSQICAIADGQIVHGIDDGRVWKPMPGYECESDRRCVDNEDCGSGGWCYGFKSGDTNDDKKCLRLENMDTGGAEDTTSPFVRIVSPANDNNELTGNTSFVAQARDDSDIQKVEFYIDDQFFKSTSTGQSSSSMPEYSVDWTFDTSKSSFELKAIAYDNSSRHNRGEDTRRVRVKTSTAVTCTQDPSICNSSQECVNSVCVPKSGQQTDVCQRELTFTQSSDCNPKKLTAKWNVTGSQCNVFIHNVPTGKDYVISRNCSSNGTQISGKLHDLDNRNPDIDLENNGQYSLVVSNGSTCFNQESNKVTLSCSTATSDYNPRFQDTGGWEQNLTIDSIKRVKAGLIKTSGSGFAPASVTATITGGGRTWTIAGGGPKDFDPPGAGTYTLKTSAGLTATLIVKGTVACQAQSVQARFFNNGWVENLQSNVGKEVKIGLFKNGYDTLSSAADVTAVIKDSSDKTVQTLTGGAERMFTPSKADTYKLVASCGSKTNTAVLSVEQAVSTGCKDTSVQSLQARFQTDIQSPWTDDLSSGVIVGKLVNIAVFKNSLTTDSRGNINFAGPNIDAELSFIDKDGKNQTRKVKTTSFDSFTPEIPMTATLSASCGNIKSQAILKSIEQKLLGDLNKDGKVDLLDFNILKIRWKQKDQSGCPGQPKSDLVCADLNRDNKINIEDFHEWLVEAFPDF